MIKQKADNRFLRQIPIVGNKSQQRLLKSKVLIVGLGGLGCPVSLYLSLAGIGHLTLIDNDKVDVTNLHRQILFTENSIGLPKSSSAYRELKKRNSSAIINQLNIELDSSNAYDKCHGHDIIIDCSDNFKTKYLLNSVSKQLEIPLVTASIFQQEAYISTLNYSGGPCLECIFPEPPPLSLIPNCSQSGVLGVDAGIIGLLQAKEIINIIIGNSKLNSKLMCLDLELLEITTRDIRKRKECNKDECFISKNSNKFVVEINFKEFSSIILGEPNTQVIDCRSKIEHLKDNIGGLNITLEELEKNYLKLNPNIPTIIYCATGKRSTEAAQFLLTKNFTKVFCLKNGINSYSFSETK